MAANSGFLFLGTDQSPLAVKVAKSKFAITQISVFASPL